MRWVQINKKWIQSQLKDLCDDLDDDHYSDPEFFTMINQLVNKLYKEYDLWLRLKTETLVNGHKIPSASSPTPTKRSLWGLFLQCFSNRQKITE